MKNNYLVTGCGKGIGRSIIKNLLENTDYKVVGIYRSEVEELSKLEQYKDRLILIRGNSSNKDVILNALEKSKLIFNSFPNKYIVNAGIRCRELIEEIDDERLANLWEINYFALRNLLKVLIKKNQIKNIALVYISSIVSKFGFENLDDYGATKAASESLIRSISIRFPESRFNVVSPGFTKSSYADDFRKNLPELYDWTIKRTPAARWGECFEISKAVLFLLDDDSSFIKGQVLHVDGGWSVNA